VGDGAAGQRLVLSSRQTGLPIQGVSEQGKGSPSALERPDELQASLIENDGGVAANRALGPPAHEGDGADHAYANAKRRQAGDEDPPIAPRIEAQ
jgi:hypothetical protein